MTDHTAEARRILHDATHDERGQVPTDLLDADEREQLGMWLAEAQVHATLAVADAIRDMKETK